MATDETAVPLSKIKIVLTVLVAAAAVALGVWMLGLTDTETGARRYPPFFVHGIGIFCTLLFGTIGILRVKKLFDTRPGLLLSGAGIADWSTGWSIGFVPWSDITGFQVKQIKLNRIVVVKLSDPEKYSAAGNWVRRIFCTSKDSISISSNTLSISFDEMVGLFEYYFSKCGTKA